MSEYGIALFPQHAALLRASAISPDVARQRNYQSVDTKARLESIDIAKAHRLVPGLLIPVYGPESSNGEAATWQYRPDRPRIDTNGKPVKYVTAQRTMTIDVPPAVRPHLDNPDRRLWVTEGIRKVDSAITAGLDCVGLLGVWNWRRHTLNGGAVAMPEWEYVALDGRELFIAYDSDVTVKDTVRKALHRLCGFLEHRGASVWVVVLPDGDDGAKTGLDDYLAAGGTVDDLEADGRIIRPSELDEYVRNGAAPPPAPYAPPAARTVTDTVAAFRRWLHLADPAPLYTVAATLVANRAPGDPVWLLVVCAPSTGKTELLSASARLPWVLSASTLTASALLSGTAAKDRARDATGGLLRQIGDFGVILAKDFTSLLAQNRDTRAEALAALREVYDGRWDRAVGTDGGKVLTWQGKAGMVGAVTPALDRYAAVVAALGDRFLLLRMPDPDPAQAGAMALGHGEHEQQMRDELADALGGLVEHADTARVNRPLTGPERDALVALATYTARARTGVERDGYTKELLYLPQVEGPGRLVKAYARLLGGLEAIGCDADTVWDTVIRVAVDSAPAIRTALVRALLNLAGPKRTSDIAESVGMVTNTAHRHLDDLALLKMADRTKYNDADNAPDYWSASTWLREHWPESTTEMYVRARRGSEREKERAPTEAPQDDDSQSSIGGPVHLGSTSDDDAQPRWEW